MSEEDGEKEFALELVSKFERMIENNDSYYFDTDQIEEIVDFYCDAYKYTEALRVIQYAYTLFPDNTTFLLREAQIMAGLGQLTKSLNRLKTLEKFDLHNQEMLLTMAGIYSQLREHKKSISIYEKVLQLGGAEYEDEIFLEIALEYENMERYDKAIETLQYAIGKQPENETLLYELAYCFEVVDRNAESIEYYKEFIERFPFSFPAWYNLGNAYQKIDQMEDALEAYDYAIAIQPDFVPAYYNKAHALFKQDRYQEAIQTFEETYTYEAPQAPVYCHIGECFEKMGEHDKALFYYRKSITTDEFYADAYLGIGVVFDLQDKTAESLTFIERAIELEPENPDYPLFLVEMLNKLGRHTDSEIITEALITRFPENEDVWLDHSDISFIKEDFLEALTRLNEGWQKNPQSTALGYRKVAYLHAAGQHVEADDLLLRMMMNDFSGAEELEEYYPEIKSNLLYIDLKKQLGAKE